MIREKTLSPKGKIKRGKEGPKDEEREQEGVYDYITMQADGFGYF